MKEIFNYSKTNPGSLFDMRRLSKAAFDEKKELDLDLKDENNAIDCE